MSKIPILWLTFYPPREKSRLHLPVVTLSITSTSTELPELPPVAKSAHIRLPERQKPVGEWSGRGHSHDCAEGGPICPKQSFCLRYGERVGSAFGWDSVVGSLSDVHRDRPRGTQKKPLNESLPIDYYSRKRIRLYNSCEITSAVEVIT